MSKKQIKLKIFPDGRIQAEVMGIPGKKCIDYISILERMLDAEAIDSERTAEYYIDDNIQTKNYEAEIIQTINRS